MSKSFGFIGLEPDDSTDAIPDKYVGTLGVWEDGHFHEELAVVVHRTADGAWPLDGPEARDKEADLADLAAILNLANEWVDGDFVHLTHEAVDTLREIVGHVHSIRVRH